MIKFFRTAVTYDNPSQGMPRDDQAMARVRDGRRHSAHPGQLAGRSAKITLYGRADKKVADRAMVCVQREKRRHFRLTE